MTIENQMEDQVDNEMGTDFLQEFVGICQYNVLWKQRNGKKSARAPLYLYPKGMASFLSIGKK